MSGTVPKINSDQVKQITYSCTRYQSSLVSLSVICAELKNFIIIMRH